MTPERWKQVEDLFYGALDYPPLERQHWLAGICHDESLCHEVIELFSYHEKHAVVDAPVQVISRAVTTLADLIGCVLDGKYKIVSHLGKGGMGSVFLATHLGTGRTVAVKVIAPEFTAYPEFAARFKREAKAAGRLRHTNIVYVTDYGTAPVGDQQIAYLVMEYLDGFTLGKMLQQKRQIPLEIVMDILEQTCLAIDRAHEQGVIHRDLKPDNIWLQPNGQGRFTVKVLDFGLAKVQDLAAFEDDGESDHLPAHVGGLQTASRKKDSALFDQHSTHETAAVPTEGGGVTRAGRIMGTPVYMSPEQCQGGGAFHASSDIYSLGVIAYQMFAGQPPFTGDTPKVLAEHCNTPPPPLWEKRSDLPKLAALQVASALAKNPARRPATATAFVTALRAHIEGEGQLAREARDLFQSHFLPLVKLSASVHLPFILLNCFLVFLLMRHWSFDFPLAWVVQAISWALPLLVIFLSYEYGTAAFALAAEQLRISPQTPLQIKPIQARIKHQRLSLLATALPGKFRASSMLSSPCAALEDQPVGGALERSQTLVNRLPSFAQSLQLRQITIGLVTLLCLQLSFSLSDQVVSVLSFSPYLGVPIVGGSMLTVSCLLYALVFPRIELARALLYFKARQVGGESVSEAEEMPTMALNRPRIFKIQRFRTPVLIAWVLLVSFGLSTSYLLFVPPVGVIPNVMEQGMEKVADNENAWTEYKQAIRKVGTSTSEILEMPGDLREYANGDLPQLTDEVRNYLDHNQEALTHLLAGAKYPKVQFPREWTKSNAEKFEGLNVFVARGPNALAMAQSRRLADQGKSRESVDMVLAAYQMATGIAQSDRAVMPILVSVACRGNALRSLFYWHSKGGADARTEIEVVHRLAEMDHRMPLPDQVLTAEGETTEKLVKERLIDQPYTSSNTFLFYPDSTPVTPFMKYFPGLRMRAFNQFMKSYPAYFEAVRPSLEHWKLGDHQKVRGLTDRLGKRWYWTPFPGDLAGNYIAKNTTFNPMALMRSMYRERAGNAALQALIACSAYQKIHGNFPEKLEPAMTELGLKVPIDPATGKPIGYRLENGKPLVWLAGADGQDDGGHTDYEYEKGTLLQPGNDFIFHYGEAKRSW